MIGASSSRFVTIFTASDLHRLSLIKFQNAVDKSSDSSALKSERNVYLVNFANAPVRVADVSIFEADADAQPVSNQYMRSFFGRVSGTYCCLACVCRSATTMGPLSLRRLIPTAPGCYWALLRRCRFCKHAGKCMRRLVQLRLVLRPISRSQRLLRVLQILRQPLPFCQIL